jgi:hypothetical protein
MISGRPGDAHRRAKPILHQAAASDNTQTQTLILRIDGKVRKNSGVSIETRGRNN